MAISTRKKNIIIADWKTGAYNKTQLVNKHKIDRKTLTKIIDGISATNADVVEVLTVAESAKKSLQNPHELKAVENVVKNRLKVEKIADKALDGLERLLDGGKAQKSMTVGCGDGVSKIEIAEYDLQAKDYKEAIDAIDKASLTTGVNARHSNTNLNVNTQNNIQINTIDWDCE